MPCMDTLRLCKPTSNTKRVHTHTPVPSLHPPAALGKVPSAGGLHVNILGERLQAKGLEAPKRLEETRSRHKHVCSLDAEQERLWELVLGLLPIQIVQMWWKWPQMVAGGRGKLYNYMASGELCIGVDLGSGEFEMGQEASGTEASSEMPGSRSLPQTKVLHNYTGSLAITKNFLSSSSCML